MNGLFSVAIKSIKNNKPSLLFSHYIHSWTNMCAQKYEVDNNSRNSKIENVSNPDFTLPLKSTSILHSFKKTKREDKNQ